MGGEGGGGCHAFMLFNKLWLFNAPHLWCNELFNVLYFQYWLHTMVFVPFIAECFECQMWLVCVLLAFAFLFLYPIQLVMDQRHRNNIGFAFAIDQIFFLLLYSVLDGSASNTKMYRFCFCSVGICFIKLLSAYDGLTSRIGFAFAFLRLDFSFSSASASFLLL